MTTDITPYRAITAALGAVLILKLLFDYFFRPARLLEHPNPRVPQLNRWRARSALVALATVGLAPLCYRLGLPIAGVLVLFGIGIVAGIVFLVCTFWVTAITGHL